MRQDNRGMSLVELTIVVAIIAVVSAVGIMSFNAMSGKPAQQCAQKLVYSLEKHRTTSASKVGAYYVLSFDPATKEIVAEEFVTNDLSLGYTSIGKSAIGAANVEITYYVDGDAAGHSLSAGAITLSFDRTSGAFKQLSSSNTATNGRYCTKIVASRGGREFEVTLVPFTGKVYID
ncbi:MAG: type II secretion system GspH family protein [Butyrivibrio sp.]|nr:type II secretion system GspH family protein [Muribaculum sp.]MCM1552432.1 type II secretion system GspH family protein [Butyrivibrio sp.]